MLRPRTTRHLIAAASLAVLLPLLAACTPSTSAPTRTPPSAASAARCAENRAAGTVTFLTGYGFAASPGILDVLAADQLGYFKDLCLDVDIKAGTGTNAALVSAGTAQIGNFGGASDVLTADSGGGKLVGIATYGNTGLVRLLARTSVGPATLAGFKGKLIGYHFGYPPQVEAMLASAGVAPSAVRTVALTGTTDLPLIQGGVAGVTGYVSSDLPELQAQTRITSFDPADYGVKSTFGTQAANASWASAHPSAVEDFLRASFHAFAWLRASDANVTTALGWAASKQGAGYDTTAERARWSTESGLALSSLPKGQALGTQSVAQWTPEVQELQKYTDLLKTTPDLATALSTSYVAAISRNGKVVWPAP